MLYASNDSVRICFRIALTAPLTPLCLVFRSRIIPAEETIPGTVSRFVSRGLLLFSRGPDLAFRVYYSVWLPAAAVWSPLDSDNWIRDWGAERQLRRRGDKCDRRDGGRGGDPRLSRGFLHFVKDEVRASVKRERRMRASARGRDGW